MICYIKSVPTCVHTCCVHPYRKLFRYNAVKCELKSSTICVWMVHVYKLDVCLSVHRCVCVEKKNQLDATEWFIALIICSTCFRHFIAHHQELKTICVLLSPVVCSAWLLVVWGQVQDSRLCVRRQ